MDSNHKLALYIAYYLSRFNVEAYKNLGYQTMNKAHEEIGKILETNPHTVKNMRDQFDPLHDHRRGWHQEPLSPSRASVVEAMKDLSEVEIRSIVLDILDGSINQNEIERNQLLSIIDVERDSKPDREFILRGPTGKKAEEYFINYYKEGKLELKGELVDKRDFGQGYDFEVNFNNIKSYIEVKGLADITGGVLFTGKEWETAKIKQSQFFLAVVYNVNTQPYVKLIQNPYSLLTAKRRITQVLQINYSVSKLQLDNALFK